MPANAQTLVDLGLTKYEAQAYLALMRRDGSAPADVARLAKIPRQRIYDVLATLVEKGLASHRPGPPARYAAVSPEFAVDEKDVYFTRKSGLYKCAIGGCNGPAKLSEFCWLRIGNI